MDKSKISLIVRLEKAMDSQYIQECTDEVIELFVEAKAEIERLQNNIITARKLRADEIREIAERWKKDD